VKGLAANKLQFKYLSLQCTIFSEVVDCISCGR
jgi:hypothetical protein